MRILFLEIDLERDWAVAALGPAFIASYLRDHGHEVDVLRVSVDMSASEVVAAITAQQPDVLGVSLTSRQWLRAKDLIAQVRAKVDITTIAGGLHATFAADIILASPGFDYACLGEGERAMLDFVRVLEQTDPAQHKTLDNLKNIKRKHTQLIAGDSATEPELHPPFEPIDELPFMARDMLDEKHGVVHITTQRGCPYPCRYCGARQFSDLYGSYANFGRRRSVDNVLAELAHIRSLGPLNYVIFLDDTFTINHAWLEEFCSRYVAAGGVPFSVHARVETVNERILQLLKSAGCAHITYGVESGSERVRREIMDRQAPNEQFRQVFAWTKQAGIIATANYIIGTPGETAAEIEQTIELHHQLQPDDFGYFVFYPYPGTALYHDCIDNGYIPKNYYELPANHRQSILQLPDLSPEDIEHFYARFTEIRKQDTVSRMRAMGASDEIVQASADAVEASALHG